MTRRNQ